LHKPPPACSGIECTPRADLGNLEEDSQATHLNTIDNSAQQPECFSHGVNSMMLGVGEEEDDDVASCCNTPDFASVPTSYDPHQRYLSSSVLSTSGELQHGIGSQLISCPPECS
jgi:hypothetical protein